jgi:hypothetical protein
MGEPGAIRLETDKEVGLQFVLTNEALYSVGMSALAIHSRARVSPIQWLSEALGQLIA